MIDRERYYLHERRVGPAQAYMVLFDDEFHRVSEGGITLDKYRLSDDETHLHKPSPERTGSLYAGDPRALSLFNISERHVGNPYGGVIK